VSVSGPTLFLGEGSDDGDLLGLRGHGTQAATRNQQKTGQYSQDTHDASSVNALFAGLIWPADADVTGLAGTPPIRVITA